MDKYKSKSRWNIPLMLGLVFDDIMSISGEEDQFLLTVTLLVQCFPLPVPPPVVGAAVGDVVVVVVVAVVVVEGGGHPHEGDYHGQGDEKSAVGNHCKRRIIVPHGEE
jgi:hypothetical protein